MWSRERTRRGEWLIRGHPGWRSGNPRRDHRATRRLGVEAGFGNRRSWAGDLRKPRRPRVQADPEAPGWAAGSPDGQVRGNKDARGAAAGAAAGRAAQPVETGARPKEAVPAGAGSCRGGRFGCRPVAQPWRRAVCLIVTWNNIIYKLPPSPLHCPLLCSATLRRARSARLVPPLAGAAGKESLPIGRCRRAGGSGSARGNRGGACL